MILGDFALYVSLQHAAEIRPGAMCANLHFGNGPLCYLRNFRHRKPLHIEQGQHQSIVGSQPRQQFGCQIARDEFGLDIPRRRSELRRKFLRFAFFNVSKTLFGTTTRAAQMIVATVNSYLGQPGFKRGRVGAVITAKRKVRFSKTILDYLFNLFALRKKPAGHAGNLTAMTLEQLFECSFVTGCGCADQDIICRLRWIHFYDRVMTSSV